MGNIGLGASRWRRRILAARVEQLHHKDLVKHAAAIANDPNEWVNHVLHKLKLDQDAVKAKWRTQTYTALLKQYNDGGYGDVRSKGAVEGFYEAIRVAEAGIVGTTTSLKPGDRTWSFAAER